MGFKSSWDDKRSQSASNWNAEYQKVKTIRLQELLQYASLIKECIKIAVKRRNRQSWAIYLSQSLIRTSWNGMKIERRCNYKTITKVISDSRWQLQSSIYRCVYQETWWIRTQRAYWNAWKK